MLRTYGWTICLAAASAAIFGAWRTAQAAEAARPNIIFFLADDMGIGDLECYGQKDIKTPNISRLAEEGTRYTECYSGSAVCAPTRCALMTGMHTGHTTRRDNTATGKWEGEGRPLVPLRSEDVTVATLLKLAGYATAGMGKWGLGNPGTTGTPDLHGFDHFYGYLDQVHAHDYYTDWLWRDGHEEPIPENKNGGRKVYSHDLMAEEALAWLRGHVGQKPDQPFFLYLAFTLPHGDHVVPSDAPYSEQPWSETMKNYAAQITRLDGDVGRVMALVKELGIDEKTIVFFTSDNGANAPFIRQFASSAGYRGNKTQLYEGGIRAPMIVRWPGKVAAGATNDFLWTHIDFLPTALELAGVQPAVGVDGMSVLPTLLGQKQPAHEKIYWEIHHPFQQAARMGRFKGIRFGTAAPLALYDLTADPREAKDISAEHPDVVEAIEDYLVSQRVESPYYPAVERPQPRGKKK